MEMEKLTPKVQLASAEGSSFLWGPRVSPPPPPRIMLKSWPLRMHFQYSGQKVRVWEQNTDIINFFFSGHK